jgi:hypothetical protein
MGNQLTVSRQYDSQKSGLVTVAATLASVALRACRRPVPGAKEVTKVAATHKTAQKAG